MLLDLFRHRGWPYPRGKEQTWHLLAVLGICIVISGAGLWWIAVSTKQPISKDELRITIQDMTSYIAQAKQLEINIHTQPFAQSYRSEYFEQLRKKIIDIHDSLTQSTSDSELAGLARTLQNIVRKLQISLQLLKIHNTQIVHFHSWKHSYNTLIKRSRHYDQAASRPCPRSNYSNWWLC